MTVKNIAVIGLGNIGKRHLQALVKTDINMDIYGVDIRELSHEDMEINKLDDDKKVVFVTGISELPRHIDLAIIATTSAVRKRLFDELVKECKVDNIVFEKVLFQSISDYKSALDSLTQKGINAWVNCGRRESRLWNDVKDILADEKEFEFHMTGGKWGLCCNGIHFLDIIKYIDGNKDLVIEKISSFSEPVKSKREGFYELFGTINGHAPRCVNWSVSCYDNDSLMEIRIYSDLYQLLIVESRGEVIVASGNDGWHEDKRKYEPEYVSDQMTRITESILESSCCKLPIYADSMDTHIEFISKLQPMLGNNEECPIT